LTSHILGEQLRDREAKDLILLDLNPFLQLPLTLITSLEDQPSNTIILRVKVSTYEFEVTIILSPTGSNATTDLFKKKQN
jgi:hypothetical protein